MFATEAVTFQGYVPKGVHIIYFKGMLEYTIICVTLCETPGNQKKLVYNMHIIYNNIMTIAYNIYILSTYYIVL